MEKQLNVNTYSKEVVEELPVQALLVSTDDISDGIASP